MLNSHFRITLNSGGISLINRTIALECHCEFSSPCYRGNPVNKNLLKYKKMPAQPSIPRVIYQISGEPEVNDPAPDIFPGPYPVQQTRRSDPWCRQFCIDRYKNIDSLFVIIATIILVIFYFVMIVIVTRKDVEKN